MLYILVGNTKIPQLERWKLKMLGCKVGECPKCGTMTRDYLTFCGECGQRIKWEDRT